MTLLEYWDNNHSNQHCFGDEEGFKLIVMVRIVDYEEMV